MNVKCNWLNCAHGMGVAHTEGARCYVGDPQDEDCKGFITMEEWVKQNEEEEHG